MPRQTQLVQEEWLKVLSKGMITIPKNWREELGIEEGKMVQAKKVANQVIIEPMIKPAPYRIYTKVELRQFLKDDRLPKRLERKIGQ